METPQYLRRYLIKKQPELRYVGSLPPLRTPHHPVKKSVKDLSIGEYREGVVVEKEGNKAKAEIGVEQLINLEGTNQKKGSRTTVRIKKIHPKLVGEIYEKDQIPIYWGFAVKSIKTNLREFLNRKDFDLSIATSRLGASINQRWEPVKTDIIKSRSIIVAFGSYKKGLYSILGGEVEIQDIFDHYLNTIPNQGVATVRTEEAIHTTLGILNIMMQ
jgi:predicted SPOUT superfamily RNA methylase MTH1